jgi:integrase
MGGWFFNTKMARKTPCKQLISEARRDYLAKGGTLTTWDGDYAKIYKLLPPGERLTPALTLKVITGTTPNTRTRQRACMAMGALARLARITVDTAAYAGNYSSKNRRADFTVELPTDSQILMYGLGLKNKSWRRLYGFMATYGIRPHEAFFLDDSKVGSDDPQLRVLEGKTGPRICYPFPREWVHRFALDKPQSLPNVNLDRSHEAIGHSATSYFSGIRAPFNLYSMRHRHALRMKEAGTEDQWAAAWQGHSQEVHRATYLRFLGPDGGASAFAKLQPKRATRINDKYGPRN